MKKIIALAADHGGYELKNRIRAHLEEAGYVCRDFGTDSAASVDYPDYAHPLCEAVAAGECELGILVCGTGIGMSMAANKHRGIRAACCGDTFSARLTREHNDANVLCMGARVIGIGLALDIVDLFTDTAFIGGKHATRVGMITEIENGSYNEKE